MTDKEFAQKFLEVFAQKILKGKSKDYLWSIFSNKLVEHLEGESARKEYDKVNKKNAFEIQYDNGYIGDKKLLPLKKEHLTAKSIDGDSLAEFYVIGKDFSWCYIITHEFNDCGPYLCYAPKENM